MWKLHKCVNGTLDILYLIGSSFKQDRFNSFVVSTNLTGGLEKNKIIWFTLPNSVISHKINHRSDRDVIHNVTKIPMCVAHSR